MSDSKALKFIPFAKVAEGLSKDANKKVGCVIIDQDYNVRVTGYNGPPRGVMDHPARLSRPEKYKGWMGHAEENAIAQAARMGVSLKGCTLIVTSLLPCTTCTRLIIQSGISAILGPDVDMSPKWQEEWEISKQMLGEAGVDVLSYDPSNHSTISVIM